MENATKALIIAGSVLLSIIVLSIFMLMVNSLTDYQQAQTQIEQTQDVISFNNQFQGYMRDDISGSDVLSVINKVTYYNRTKASDAVDNAGSGDEYVYEPITLIVELGDISKRKLLSMDGTNLKLLTKADGIFTFDGKDNMDKTFETINNLLNKTKMPTPPQSAQAVTGFETILPVQYQGKTRTIYYTEGILKGLMDNYGSANSIFENGSASYINQNGTTESIKEKRKRFTEFDRIVGTAYFPLEYKNGTPLAEVQYKSWWEKYFGTSPSVQTSEITINGVKQNKTIRQVLELYHEYAQFQRAKFKYVPPTSSEETYSSGSGRIKYLKFVFTGEFI